MITKLAFSKIICSRPATLLLQNELVHLDFLMSASMFPVQINSTDHLPQNPKTCLKAKNAEITFRSQTKASGTLQQCPVRGREQVCYQWWPSCLNLFYGLLHNVLLCSSALFLHDPYQKPSSSSSLWGQFWKGSIQDVSNSWRAVVVTWSTLNDPQVAERRPDWKKNSEAGSSQTLTPINN